MTRNLARTAAIALAAALAAACGARAPKEKPVTHAPGSGPETAASNTATFAVG